ncbi:MAG: hypothetical protein HC921_16380 [Synechococcaceae cyanobacterium SM2_3_1]|nr:hypothetical protein [Synechococcaceae cyanobacterium SM2_3_1]
MKQSDRSAILTIKNLFHIQKKEDAAMHFNKRGPSLWCLGSLLAVPAHLACTSSAHLTIEPHVNESVSLSALDPGPLEQRREIDISSCPEFGSIWRYESDGLVDRTGLSDINAVYWVATLPLLNSNEGYYTIRGQYPEARFFSLEVYDPNPVDSLLDFQIQPDRGSSNPFSGRGSGADKNYTISLSPSGFTRLTGNSLFTGDAPYLNYYVLMYRIYDGQLPEEGLSLDYQENPQQLEKQGGEKLPQISYVSPLGNQAKFQSQETICSQVEQQGNFLEQLGQNLERLADSWTANIQRLEPNGGRLANDPPIWFVGESLNSALVPLFGNYPLFLNKVEERLENAPPVELFTNAANSYLSTYLNSEYGDVFVLQFKAPTFPGLDTEDRVVDMQSQVQYWSFCTYNLTTGYTGDCLQDSQFVIDEERNAQLVVSWPSNRPSDPDTGLPVENWLPFSGFTTLLIYRHLLPSNYFRRSHYFYERLCDRGWDLNCFGRYQAIQLWMGEYYPEGTYCSRAEFESGQCILDNK